MNITLPRMLSVTFAAILAAASTTLAATYSYNDNSAAKRILYVNVAAGDTETFDITWMEPHEASVTNIVKRGDGTLDIPSATDLSGYTFDIVVEDGIFTFYGNKVLGTAGGTITVCDGATLQNTAYASNASLGTNWKIRFTGTGHNGMGALYKSGYSYGQPFGSQIMTGDAKAVMYSSAQDNMGPLDMNGHELDLYLQAGYFINVNCITNNGAIHIHGNPAAASSFVQFDGWNVMYGKEENTLSFSDIVWNVANIDHYLAGLCWSLDFREGSGIKIVSGPSASGRNVWQGPVHIGPDRLPVTVSADKDELGFTFTNLVSGGGFDLQGLDTTTLAFHLTNPGNVFTNGITGRNAELHLAANGALPTNGGALVLTNSTVVLEEVVDYSLPAAKFSGNCAVTGGRGQWASIAKTGTGTLEYDSAVGAGSLDIASGTVDFTGAPGISGRGAFAGLVEGRKLLSYADSANDRYAVYNLLWSKKVALATNAVTLGTRLLYDWTRNAETAWTTNMLLSYTGYIWNDSTTNETWAFAGGGANNSNWRLTIDGADVVGKAVWSSTKDIDYSAGNWAYDLHTNKVVIAPGPHWFEYRHSVPINAGWNYGLALCDSISGYGTYTRPEEVWAENRGLMFNRTGVCSRNIADYQMLVDPGDGSLFTWDIPPETGTLSHPVTGEPVNGCVSLFQALRMAPGTALLVPEGLTWEFTDVEGLPTVTGGSVTVAGAWTVRGKDAGSTPFAITGTLTFGPGAYFVAPAENDQPADGEIGGDIYVLGTAAGGIVNAPATATSPHWRVFVDGNSVMAEYLPPATVIILR